MLVFKSYSYICHQTMDDRKEIPMQKQNRLFIMLTAALVLVFMLSIMGGSASASSPNAPKPSKTPTLTPTSTGPTPTPAPTVSSTELTQGWSLISANNVADSGSTISQTGYNVSTWYPITVPSTVLAGLVANNVYQNIYFGTNLKSVPDLTTQNWWYRGQFSAPAAVAGQQYWLRFKGVSYRSQIWFNGTQIDANAVGSARYERWHLGQSIPGYNGCSCIARSLCEDRPAFARDKFR